MSLIIFLLPLLTISTLHAYQCHFETESATFDICSLQLTSSSILPFYEVFDIRDEYEKNFTYLFNIGDNIQSNTDYISIADICTNETLRKLNNKVLGPCNDDYISITTDDYICQNDTIIDIEQRTSVYQLHRDMDTHNDCFRLHDGLTEPEFVLNDENDPTLGFRLIFRNGDWCQPLGRNREFEINFLCSDISETVPSTEQSIVEGAEETDDDIGCWYTLQYNSTFGCPLECPVVELTRYINGEVSHSLHLCSGNGLCSYDESNHRPMCFCYSGYFGDDCSLSSDPDAISEYEENDTPWIIGLAVIFFVLAFAILVILYLLRRIYYEKIVGNHIVNMMEIEDDDGSVGDKVTLSGIPTKRGGKKKVKDGKHAGLLDDEEGI